MRIVGKGTCMEESFKMQAVLAGCPDMQNYLNSIVIETSRLQEAEKDAYNAAASRYNLGIVMNSVYEHIAEHWAAWMNGDIIPPPLSGCPG